MSTGVPVKVSKRASDLAAVGPSRGRERGAADEFEVTGTGRSPSERTFTGRPARVPSSSKGWLTPVTL